MVALSKNTEFIITKIILYPNTETLFPISEMAYYLQIITGTYSCIQNWKVLNILLCIACCAVENSSISISKE